MVEGVQEIERGKEPLQDITELGTTMKGSPPLILHSLPGVCNLFFINYFWWSEEKMINWTSKGNFFYLFYPFQTFYSIFYLLFLKNHLFSLIQQKIYLSSRGGDGCLAIFSAPNITYLKFIHNSYYLRRWNFIIVPNCHFLCRWKFNYIP